MDSDEFIDGVDELFAGFGQEDLRDDFTTEHARTRSDEHKNDERSSPNVLCSQNGPDDMFHNGEEANGFHLPSGRTYIYPTNYPVRQYQSNIVRTALFKNTLVTLPTGLGKTFIAAVVMYNFYRWYPCCKVIFMAPTRPLVAQQIKACHNIMNLPVSDTTEMTGIQNAELRKSLWKEKRVFFLTPQVLVNDLRAKICPAESIKCIVVDEAHRAVKDYAYCQVIKLLQMVKEAEYRVLALSATPGSDINAVQQIIQNLQITAMEVRGEDSLDVAPYTHTRAIDTIVVSPSVEMQRVKDDFLQVYEKYARRLKEFKSLSSNISTLSKFQILKALEKFKANPPRGLNPSAVGSLVCDFTVCMSLAHALELLQIYGLRAFYTYLSDEHSEKCKAASSRLKNDEDLKKLLRKLKTALYPNSTQNLPYIWGHPKLQKLVFSLTEHFKNYQQNKLQTKAIIFCQYRIVVSEIAELLEKSKPNIRAAVFVGQSGGKEKGMPQAKQLQIMKEFREGKINCLIATSVAEEGLDIGDVDLIVLMEAHKSPVRLVQRIGRTGRKRKGHCVVLLSKGKEEQKFHEAMATRKSYVSNITNSNAIKSSLCQYAPSMFPPNIKPEQQLLHICVSKLEPTPEKKPKKQVDIRHCLTNDTPFLSEEEFDQVFQELGTKDVCMKRIPGPKEIWHRRFDRKMELDELFDTNSVRLSDTNDWNREINRTFKVSSSDRSKHLTELLSAKRSSFVNCSDEELEKLIEEPEADGQRLMKESKDEDNDRKSKKVKKDVKNADIRSCMAVAAEKATKKIEIIEIDDEPEHQMRKSFMNNVFDLKEIERVLYSDSISCVYDKNTEMGNRFEKYMKPCSCKMPEFDLNTNFDFIFEPGILKNFDVTKFKDHNEEPQIYPDEIEFYTDNKTPSDIVGIDDLFDLCNSPIEEKLEKNEILTTSKHLEKLEDTEILKKQLSDDVIDDLFGLGNSLNKEKLEDTQIIPPLKELPSSDDIVGIDDLFQNSSDELKPTSQNEIQTQKDFDNKKLSRHEIVRDTSLIPVQTIDDKTDLNESQMLCATFTSPKVTIPTRFQHNEDVFNSKSDFENNLFLLKKNINEDILDTESQTTIITNKFQLAVENLLESKISHDSNDKPLVSSTPKNAVNKGKTFKKKNIAQKYDHLWNIDDFFNDDDDLFENVRIPSNESTLYGVTQLTSMIMKDKQSKIDDKTDLNESTMLGVTQLTSMIMKDKKNAEPSTSNYIKSDLLASPEIRIPTCSKTPDNKTPDVFQFKSPTSSKCSKTPKKKPPDIFQFKLKSPDVSPILKKSEIFQFRSPEAQSLPSSSPSPVKRPRIKNKKAHRFIEHEADVSGEGTADESENSSLNDFDDSFIDDQSLPNVAHSNYLKSIKSPVHGKYKIPAPRAFVDVFSQQVEQDEYQNDSFCVDTDEEEETVEPSLLEVFERELAQKTRAKDKKLLQSSSSSSPDDFTTPGSNIVIKKRKRILDSDTDNDTTPKAKKNLKYDSSPVFPIFSKKKSHDSDEEYQEVLKLSQIETTVDPEKLFQQEIQEAIRLSQIEASKPNFKNLPSTSRSLFQTSEPPKPNLKSFKKQQKIVDTFKKL